MMCTKERRRDLNGRERVGMSEDNEERTEEVLTGGKERDERLSYL